MESQSTTHQTTQKPAAQREIDTDLVVSSSDDAPLESRDKPISTKCFEMPLEMFSDSQHGSRGINFSPALNSQQQQKHLPPSSATYIGSSSSPFQSETAMNANFYRCLRSGQIDILKRMLDYEEDSLLDQVTPQHNTALHIVARQGLDQLIMPILTRRPAVLTQQNVNGDTALHLAAEAGQLGSVVSILEFVGDANLGRLCEMQNKDDETALHVAVMHKHTRVAIFLIRAHPKASYCLNGRGESPLFVAAELGELQIVKDMLLMASGIDVQSALVEGKSVVHAAILGGNSGVLEAILSNHRFLFNSTVISMNGVSVSPLSYAAFKGDIQMVRYILTQFPDSAYRWDLSGTFPAHTAASEGHKTVLEEFLKFHPDSRELLT